LWASMVVNAGLAAVNLIPLPPLDGSKILAGVSSTYADLIDRVSMLGPMLLVIFLMRPATRSLISQAASLVREIAGLPGMMLGSTLGRAISGFRF